MSVFNAIGVEGATGVGELLGLTGDVATGGGDEQGAVSPDARGGAGGIMDCKMIVQIGGVFCFISQYLHYLMPLGMIGCLDQPMIYVLA